MKGSTLVITLVIVALLLALAFEFVYTVQVQTALLENFCDSQTAYSMASSGIRAATSLLLERIAGNYTYLDTNTFKIRNPYASKMGNIQDVKVTVEDESGKFNVNSIVSPSGNIDPEALNNFKKLLAFLELRTEIVERIVEKNSYLDSVDELLLVPGLDQEGFKKLKPYITVYGDSLININTADIPVLISIAGEMDEELARRIKTFREKRPFTQTSDIMKVPGFESLGINLIGKITVKSKGLFLKSAAESNEIKKEIQAIVAFNDGIATVKYWRER